jgi:nucleoside-diphosphate-sugar epimerase
VSENFWQNKKVIVTGGAGFLGSFVIEKLKGRGTTDIFIPRIENYNLVDANDIKRLYSDTLKDVDPKNVVIIHLAANVGGIGANREHPADFFYDNLMMGVELMHQHIRMAWANLSPLARSVPIPNSRLSRSRKMTCGWAIPKRRMLLTA